MQDEWGLRIAFSRKALVSRQRVAGGHPGGSSALVGGYGENRPRRRRVAPVIHFHVARRAHNADWGS